MFTATRGGLLRKLAEDLQRDSCRRVWLSWQWLCRSRWGDPDAPAGQQGAGQAAGG
jgi:hypothetical protein